MADSPDPSSTHRSPDDQHRRSDRRNALDFVQYVPATAASSSAGAIEVYFSGPVPPALQPANVVVEPVIADAAHAAPLAVRAVEVPPAGSPADPDAHATVWLSAPIPAAQRAKPFQLRLVNANTDEPLAGFDRQRTVARLSFAGPIAPEPEPPPAVPRPPDINYLAKDFPTCRQMILDRMALTVPDWTEQSLADLGVTLVDVLAYTADYLSYFQDAVATEAYLNTARRRISVRRHARLVDYTMHEGCNARAWVCLQVEHDVTLPAACRFVAGHADAVGPVLSSDELVRMQATAALPVVFEPVATGKVKLWTAHGKIAIHTYGEARTYLPAGATRADLVDCAALPRPEAEYPPDRVLRLQPGDVLIFEEAVSPATGVAADADASHRHAVRLTTVTPTFDVQANAPVLRVTWTAEDALPFRLTLIATGPAPACRPITGVSVVRGNVVLVDHGQTVAPETVPPPPMRPATAVCAKSGPPRPTSAVPLPSLFATVTLSAGPVTHRSKPVLNQPAATAIAQDPRSAVPAVTLVQANARPGDDPWSARHDLLHSDGEDRVFVVEIDDDGRACLRFGDGVNGLAPDPNAHFTATYRVGNGSAGNVGSDRITAVVLADPTDPAAKQIECIRNPLPAAGGTDPESVDDVRLNAPTAYAKVLERAITPDDYVTLAEAIPGVQRASATLGPGGGRQLITVAVDALGTEAPDPKLLDQVRRTLDQCRLIGQDVVVVPATYVPIDLTVTLTVATAPDGPAVKARVADLLSNRLLADGSLGFFHPDNLTFGSRITVNAIEAICTIAGVVGVRVKKLRRTGKPDAGELAAGELVAAAEEIPQLDNDLTAPERGTLKIKPVVVGQAGRETQ